MNIQVVTPVSFTVDYADAPIDKVGVIEVYSQSNCKAFSVKDNKPSDCTLAIGPRNSQTAFERPRRALQSPREVL